MAITTLWILISSIGLAFSVYELIKSWSAYKDIRNARNGRKIVATDMLVRAALFVLMFLDFTGIGILSHILLAANFSYATQELVRNAVTRPAIVFGVVLLLMKLVSSTYTRIRLEREDKKHE